MSVSYVLKVVLGGKLLPGERFLSWYLSGNRHPQGCLVVCTAVTEANEQPAIRSALQGGLNLMDAAFEERFAAEVQTGRAPDGINAKQSAAIASAIFHSLAVRARAGQSRASLFALASAATSLLVTSRQRHF